MSPTELLNRWFVPLESRVDFLTLATGKKIQIPFEQFDHLQHELGTEPTGDDAFLRRIPYKIEVRDPSPTEYHKLVVIREKKICVASITRSDRLFNRETLQTQKPSAASLPTARFTHAGFELLLIQRPPYGTAA